MGRDYRWTTICRKINSHGPTHRHPCRLTTPSNSSASSVNARCVQARPRITRRITDYHPKGCGGRVRKRKILIGSPHSYLLPGLCHREKADWIAAGLGTATDVGFLRAPSTVADTGASPSTQRPPRLAKGWGAGALKRQTVDGVAILNRQTRSLGGRDPLMTVAAAPPSQTEPGAGELRDRGMQARRHIPEYGPNKHRSSPSFTL